jgi:uncharacterized protein HemX
MTNLEFIARVGRQHKIDTNKKWVVGLLVFGAGACLVVYLIVKDSKRKGQTIKKQASELEQVKYANKEFATVNKVITEKSASQEQKINELEREKQSLVRQLNEKQKQEPEA